MFNFSILILVFFFTSTSFGKSHCNSSETSVRDWYFFDLGNTLIDSKQDGRKQRYLPGAKNYIEQLKKHKACLGLISNIPVSWGKDFEERFETLKKYVSDNWEPKEPAFQWNDFEVVFLPGSESEYKPEPTMFKKAQTYAKKRGATKIYFQGEDSKEVEMARSLGFLSHLVTIKNGTPQYRPLSVK